MWIILGILLSFTALALDPNEKLTNVKIIRVFPDNVIMLNRGLEDGIQKNNHAKISNESFGYSSRAICLNVETDASTWKLYRVPHSKAFSMDYSYTITGYEDKEIPLKETRINRE